MSAQKGYILPLVLFGSVAILSGVGLFLYMWNRPPQQVSYVPLPTPQVTPVAITDFESCVKAGNPVMESYPRQCSANGKSFTEVIEQPVSTASPSAALSPEPTPEAMAYGSLNECIKAEQERFQDIEYAPGQVLVTFVKSTSQTEGEAILSKYSLKVKDRLSLTGTFIVTVPVKEEITYLCQIKFYEKVQRTSLDFILPSG